MTVRSLPVSPPRGPMSSYSPETGAFAPGGSVSFLDMGVTPGGSLKHCPSRGITQLPRRVRCLVVVYGHPAQGHETRRAVPHHCSTAFFV